MKNNAVIILGMHRSGTSMVSGCLKRAGVDLGEHLLPPNEANPKGYWELVEVVRFHDRLLKKHDMAWNSAGSLPTSSLSPENTQDEEAELAEILKRNFSTSPTWAVKDPRTCRFLPLWKRVLEALSVNYVLLNIIRPPEGPAKSLQERDNLPSEQGTALWMTYNLDIIDTLEPMSKYRSLRLDEFLNAPAEQVQQTLSLLAIDPTTHRPAETTNRGSLRSKASPPRSFTTRPSSR